MMKNKILNKVLLFVVALIWGFIIKQYFFSSKKPDVIQTNTSNFKIEKTDVSRKKFEMNPIKRDPFLNTLYQKKQTPKIKKKTTLDKKVTKHVFWPKIKYLGFIKNHITGKENILLRVNNQMKKISKDKPINDLISVKHIYKDSIVLSQENVLKTFYR